MLARKVTYYMIPIILCSGEDKTKKKENGSGISRGYSGGPQRGSTGRFFRSDGTVPSVLLYIC